MRVALVFLLGCSKTLNVNATVISACDQPDAVAQAMQFTLRVEGASLDTARETSVDAAEGGLSLGDIPPTLDGRLTLFDAAQALAGGLGSLDLTGKASSAPLSIRLVVGRVGTFVGTTQTGEPPTCSIMQRGRQGQTATRLPNGTVMIAGGEQFQNGEKQLLRSVEIFDPNTGTFAQGDDLPEARAYHTATLTDGKVLFCGGQGSLGGRPVALSTCILFDTAKKAFASSSIALNAARQLHTATLLADDRVLLIAGVGTGGDFLTSTELYDPHTPTERLVAGPAINTARMQHSATILPDGTSILVAGGRTRDNPVGTLEIWTADGVHSAGTGLARYGHAAVRVSDGRVILAGGFTNVVDAGDPVATAAIEIYDAGIGCADMLALGSARGGLAGESLPAVAGRDAAVLFVGGSSTAGAPLRDADIVTLGRQRSCASAAVSSTGGKLKQARTRSSAVLLSGGDVLIVGGSQTTTGTVIAADAGELFVSPR